MPIQYIIPIIAMVGCVIAFLIGKILIIPKKP